MDVTRDLLASALAGRGVIVNDGHGGIHSGEIADTLDFADEVMSAMAALYDEARAEVDDDGRCEFNGDAELTAMAAMTAAMDSLPDEGDTTTSGAPWRVLQYIAARYGFVLATED